MPNKNGAKNAQKTKAKPAAPVKTVKPTAKAAAPKVTAKPVAKAAPPKGKSAAAPPAPATPVKDIKKGAVAAPAPSPKGGKPTAEPKPAVTEAKAKKEEAAPVTQAAGVPLASEPPPDEDVILTDAEGRRYCKVKDCDQYAVVEDHCRFHYLLLWKRIQVRRRILIDGKLERYVEELTARYPDKFLEMIRKDLRSEKDFHSAIAELEIDESAMDNEFEDENNSFIDEVRGMSSEPAMADEEEF